MTIPKDYLGEGRSIIFKKSDFSVKLDGKDVAAEQFKVAVGPKEWSDIDYMNCRVYQGTTNFRVQVTGPAGASKLQVSYTFKYGEVKETATAEGDVSAKTAQ